MKKYLRPYYAKEKNIFQKNQTQKKRLELALKKFQKNMFFILIPGSFRCFPKIHSGGNIFFLEAFPGLFPFA